ncbi:hypothetical protein THRCLA_20314 [Thraustotheca clavata]|uniref:PI31 proteasome regulator N-terminal domain-containing protein n=1 Tax=Thraustotheca clavata TaxID=74557 RepID=A0A1W0A8Q8_9STRA|nr:hypothetical protein THRCLA_20314 [Thraustotheca clavata]
MDQAKKDRDELKAVIDGMADGVVKTHMLKSLAELDAKLNEQSSEDDALLSSLRQQGVLVKRARDALCLIGFVVQDGQTKDGDGIYIPSDWEKHLKDGIFVCKYVFAKKSSQVFELKALFIENTLAVHITNAQQSESSTNFSAGTFIRDLTAADINAADALQNIATLRQQWSNFIKMWLPKEEASRAPPRQNPPPPPSSSLQEPRNIYPNIPTVGRGDIMPDFGFGGHQDPGMLVGPNHPLFGGPPSFPGTVPGARFDPFGPVGPRPMHPFNPHPRQPQPAPRMPFGGPDPDHLRMPGDRNPDVDHMFY